MSKLDIIKTMSQLIDGTQRTNPDIYSSIYDAIREMEYFSDFEEMMRYTVARGFVGLKFIDMINKDFGGDAFKYGEHLLRTGYHKEDWL